MSIIRLSLVAKSRIINGDNPASMIMYFHITLTYTDCSGSNMKEGRFRIPPANAKINKINPIAEGIVPLGGDFGSISKEIS